MRRGHPAGAHHMNLRLLKAAISLAAAPTAWLQTLDVAAERIAR